MKRVLLVTLLVIAMLTMLGFTPAEATYWENMKEIYEWNAMEGLSEAEVDISFPEMGLDYQLKIVTDSQSSMDDLVSYSKIKVNDVKGQLNVPVIEMYTNGGDLYINKEAVLSLLSAMGMADGVSIKEEFLMLEGGQKDVDVDFNNILNDTLALLEDMDLGVDLGMEKQGDTYVLTLESGELIDLLEAYFRYFVENVDNLPASLTQGQQVEITAAEKQEAIEQFNAFVSQYKDMVKALITGSKFHMESTFGEGKYKENSQIVIKTPMGSVTMNTKATTSKIEKVNFELPTSVRKITADELEELLMSKIGGVAGGAKLVMELDGSYVKFDQPNIKQGKVSLKVENGKAYMTVEDANKLLGVKLEGMESPFHVRKLDDYGFRVEWNEKNRTIEIY